jgi:hypothetical protein
MPLLRVNGYDMTYVESGSGPVLLLLHGTLSDDMAAADGSVRCSIPHDCIVGRRHGMGRAMALRFNSTSQMWWLSSEHSVQAPLTCSVFPEAATSHFGSPNIIRRLFTPWCLADVDHRQFLCAGRFKQDDLRR